MGFNYNNYDNSSDSNELIYDLRQTYAKLLDEILTRLAECRLHKDYIRWFEALDDLHTEISQKLKKDEKKEYEKNLRICVGILNQHPAVYNKQSQAVEGVYAIKSALKNLEMWLKEMMEAHKMYGAREEVVL